MNYLLILLKQTLSDAHTRIVQINIHRQATDGVPTLVKTNPNKPLKNNKALSKAMLIDALL